MDPIPSNNLIAPPELTPLEQEVLEEYERLAENMKKVCWDSTAHYQNQLPDTIQFNCLIHLSWHIEKHKPKKKW